MASIPHHYHRHLEDILDRLNASEEEFTEPVIEDYGSKGTVSFSPAKGAEPVQGEPNDEETPRPDRLTGGRQNRKPA